MADGRRQLGRRAAPRSVWVAVLILAAVCLAAGFRAAVQHVQAESPRPYRLSGAIVLLALAACQARLAHRVWRRGLDDRGAQGLYARRVLDASLLATGGAVLAFVTAVFVGPDSSSRYLFRALLAADATVMAWFTLAPPPAVLSWIDSRRWPLTAARMLAASLLCLAAAELALRLYTVAADPDAPLVWHARHHALTSRCQLCGRRVSGRGHGADEFVPSGDGAGRVAVLAGDVGLWDDVGRSWLDCVERGDVPLEICNCSLAGSRAVHHAAMLAREVTPLRPRTVLVVLDVASLGQPGLALPGRFDWRSFQLYQRFAGLAPAGEARAADRAGACATPSTSDAWPQMLSACRSPIPEEVQDRYRETQAAVQRLADQCGQRNIELKLVLAPASYQVDRGLCRRLCLRYGLDIGELDLELPQRRLAACAAQCGAQSLDLLPLMRAADESLYERESNAWNRAGHALVGRTVAQWLTAPEQVARRTDRGD